MEIKILNHLFWECRHVQNFWMQLIDFLKAHKMHLKVTLRNITFVLQKRSDSDFKIKKNNIILIAKYFIYSNKYLKAVPVWEGSSFI